MVNRLSVKVSAPRMDGSSVGSVGGLIVAAGRLSQTVGGEYFSSLLDWPHLSKPELWIDTLAYFKEKHPGERCSLNSLCERYQIQEPEGTNLDTLRDAKILGELYFKFSTSQ